MPAKSSRPIITDPVDQSQLNSNSDARLWFNRGVVFFVLAIGGCGLDLLTKSLVFQKYFHPEIMVAGRTQPVEWWISGVFGIQCSTNPGALFGIGKGFSLVFALISFVAIFGILIWLFRFGQARDRWINCVLGIITGGILGNLYDRLGFGYRPEYPIEIRDNVRDWILFRWEGGWRIFDPWPNFNIADSLLVVGAAMLFLHAFFVGEPPEQLSDADEPNESDKDQGNETPPRSTG